MLNFIKRYWPTALATLILLTALTGVYAKYVVDQTIDGVASITAKLGSIDIWESQATADTTGQYTLDQSVPVKENAYAIVLPGLDIPKDPYVQITNKSPIPAYVYLVIENDTLPSSMTYSLESHWTLVTENPKKVYVYSDSNGTPLQVTGDTTIPVLQNDMVYVSQKLQATSFTEVNLTFSACMKQYVDSQTAAQIYGNT